MHTSHLTDHVTKLYHHGMLFMQRHKYRESIRAFEKIIMISESRHAIDPLIIEKSFEHLIYLFTCLIKQNPCCAQDHYNRGWIHLKHGDAKKSICDFTKAIVLKPYYSKAYFNRALAYVACEKYEKAILDLYSSIDVLPVCSEKIFKLLELKLDRLITELSSVSKPYTAHGFFHSFPLTECANGRFITFGNQRVDDRMIKCK